MKKRTKITLGVVGGTALLCTAGYAIFLAILYKSDRDRSDYEGEYDDYDSFSDEEDDDGFFDNEENNFIDKEIEKEYDEEDKRIAKESTTEEETNSNKKPQNTKMDGNDISEMIRRDWIEAHEKQKSEEQKKAKTMAEVLHDFLMS